MSNAKVLIWMPTWACNLRCVHCSARHLPHRLHGKPVSPQKWIDVFSQHEVAELHISGGEPSLYPVADVLEAVRVPFTFDTNLRINPETILRNDDIAMRCKSFNVSLQFSPSHKEADIFWKHLAWLRERYPYLTINATFVVYWRDDEAMWEEIKRRFEEYEVPLYLGSWDWTFMCDEPPKPHYAYVGRCSAGHYFGVLAPDGSCHRCIGWLYNTDRKPALGNVFAHEWDDIFADKMMPCDYAVCTVCDMVVKEDEIKWEDLEPSVLGRKC